MIDEDLDEQIKDDVPAIEQAKVLLGFMLEGQAKRWFFRDYSVRNRWGPHLSREEREEIVEENADEFEDVYSTATSGLEPPSEFRATETELVDLPESEAIQSHIENFTESEYFQGVFGDAPEEYWDIKLVPLECLVAYQPHVTTRAHQEIPTSDDGLLHILKYCLPMDVKNFLHVSQNQIPDHSGLVKVICRNPNINFVGPVIQPIEDRPAGNISIQVDVRARPNFVQVAHFEGRYILKNGYHRCYQLLNAGEEYVPAVVFYAQKFGETGAEGAGWFPDEMILGDRPPLVPDFFTDAAVNFEMKNQNKMIRLLVEKMDVEI